MGERFAAKPPSQLSHIPPETKLAVVALLTAENEERLDGFFYRMQQGRGGWEGATALSRVRLATDVDAEGKICLASNRKTDASILAKSRRPTILECNPHFSVEHVR